MEMRRQRRIIYQTRIRLRAPGRDDSVIARVQNLSPRGVFVIAADIPAAGTEVQCRFTLAGQRRTLRGRVAWVRAPSLNEPPHAAGAGIEFLDLEAADQHLLGRLVEPPPEALVAVDVNFEGLASPVRCRAVVAGDGLRLVTGLPFMRLDSRVAVRFQGSSGEHHEGTIDSVTLEPSGDGGIPQLELNVSLDLPVGSDPFALPVVRAPAPSTGLRVPLSTTVVSASLSAPPPPTPRLVGAAADQTVRVAMGSARLLRAQLDARLGRLLRAARRQWLPLSAGFAMGALLVAAAIVTWRPAAPSAPPPSLARSPAAAVPPRPAPLPVAAAVPAPTSQPAAPVVAPEAVTPAESPPVPLSPSPSPIPGITIHSEGRQLRLVMPLIGNGRGSEQYRLVEPPGLAITLPRGRPRVITGVYRPEGGPVKVQVRRRAPGSHLRFFLIPRATGAP